MEFHIYFDASIQDYKLRIGYIIVDSNGNHIASLGRNTLSTTDSTQGEIIALIHAIRKVISYEKYVEDLVLYSDSHSVVVMFDDSEPASPSQDDIDQLVTVACRYLSTFNYTITYIDSESNPAHNLAYYS